MNSGFGRALRGNAHALNLVVLLGATLGPALLYANMRAPTQEEVAATLVRARVPRPAHGQRGGACSGREWRGARAHSAAGVR